MTRKVCGGDRGDRGAVTQGRLTVFRTATQQGIDAVDCLVNLSGLPTHHRCLLHYLNRTSTLSHSTNRPALTRLQRRGQNGRRAWPRVVSQSRPPTSTEYAS